MDRNTAQSTLQQKHDLFWLKYWDIHDENNMLKLYVNEKDETIAQLRRDLLAAKIKIAKLEQKIDPITYLASASN
jgi:hypothetical protein